jgi:colicin import membrane protein
LLRLLRERPRPFVYAVLVHAALLAVLMFSLDWESIRPTKSNKPAPVQAVVIDGAKLDAEVKRKQELEAQKVRDAEAKRKRIEAEKARAVEEKQKAEARKKAEAKKQVEARKKAEAEKQRKAEEKKKAEAKKQAEAKKKAEAEAKRKADEKKKAEAKKQAEAKKKAEAEKQRKAKEEAQRKAKEEAQRKAKEEAQRKAAEKEMQDRLAAEQEHLATQRRSAMQRMIDEYVLYIQEKVQRSWIRPPSSGGELSCTVEVRLIPSGEVIDAQIVRSSGNDAFDRSVEAAVLKASPLPVPPDPDVMEQFRTLRFEFKPE